MIKFKKMWDDVLLLLSKEEYIGIDIEERLDCGFTVNDSDNKIFITKDDFCNFWCKLLYYEKISIEQLLGDDKLKYVYTIIKQLPYISESSGIVKLVY